MSNINKISKTITVLGCPNRDAPYTQAQYAKDVQVYHFSNKHHQNQLYDDISPKFVNSIQFTNNPSGDYSNKMKNIYMDELDTSLNQYKNKMMKINTEIQEFRKDYKENVNSLVLYIEKDSNRRHQAMKTCLKRQQERQNRFIDANLLKNQRIDQYINKNQYNNCLGIAKSQFLSELEKQRERLQYQKSPRCNNELILNNNNNDNSQICYINQNQSQLRNQKQKNYSVKFNTPVGQKYEISERKNNEDDFSNKQKYGNRSILKNKYLSQHQKSEVMNSPSSKIPLIMQQKLQQEQDHSKIYRVHNPITNPIEYHIDNPYFINKMQSKFEIPTDLNRFLRS